MTKPSSDFDERAFQTAWARFIEADARVTAPDDLEPRVRQAVCRTLQSRREGWRVSRPRTWATATTVAALVIFAVAMVKLPRMSPNGDAAFPSRHRGPAAPVSPADIQARPKVSQSATHTRSDVPIPHTTEPVPDSEPLHLVRVRIPGAALRAAGVTYDEPDGTDADVDVDVVVGDDGFPKEIRRVQPVTSNGT